MINFSFYCQSEFMQECPIWIYSLYSFLWYSKLLLLFSLSRFCNFIINFFIDGTRFDSLQGNSKYFDSSDIKKVAISFFIIPDLMKSKDRFCLFIWLIISLSTHRPVLLFLEIHNVMSYLKFCKSQSFIKGIFCIFASGLQLYQKRDSGTGVFLWILRNF